MTLEVMPLFAVFHEPNRWVPIRCIITNDGDDELRCAVQFAEPARPLLIHSSDQDSNEAASMLLRSGAIVPPRSRATVVAYCYFDADPIALDRRPTPNVVRVILQEAGGRELRRQDLRSGFQGQLIVCHTQRRDDPASVEYNRFQLPAILTALRLRGMNWGSQELDDRDMPEHLRGYDGVAAVVLDDADPDLLNAAQRAALEQYVQRGGTLIIASPTPRVDLAAGWLGHMLPVHILGSRQADRLTFQDALVPAPSPLIFGRHFHIAEAIDAGGEVLLRDGPYVHIAVRRVGAGSVVFTSFPLAALGGSAQDPRAAGAVLSLLLGSGTNAGWREAGISLRPRQEQIMQHLAGAPAPRWRLALMFGGGYLALVALTHLWLHGTSRPRAYAMNLAVGLLLSAGLVGMQMVSDRGSSLTGARVVTVDLGADGAGRQQELLAYLGANRPELKLRPARPSVSIRPEVAGRLDPPWIELHPHGVAYAGASTQGIARLWTADASVTDMGGLDAILRFDADGAHLEVDNRTGRAIDMPALLSDYRLLPVGPVPAGKSRHTIGAGIGPALLSQAARLRMLILDAAESSAQPLHIADAAPSHLRLAGWVDDVPALVVTDPPLAVPAAAQVMLRSPVRIAPSPVGSAVRIDGVFTRLVRRDTAIVPMLPRQDAWQPMIQRGVWKVAFAAPPPIGRLRITRATVELDAVAPEHTITLRRGGGRPLASWSAVREPRSVSFEPAADDLDGDGWVLLTIDVEPPARSGGAVPPPWQVVSLRMSYEATVEGPPFIPVTGPR